MIDINKAETDNGATQLYIAWYEGHNEIVNALLSQEESRVNKATTKNGQTQINSTTKKVQTERITEM